MTTYLRELESGQWLAHTQKPRAGMAQGFEVSLGSIMKKRYFLGFWFLTVLVVFEGVVPTGLPVASTGLFEVPAEGVPAVLDRLGAMLPELLWPALLAELVPAGRLPVGVVPAGVVCACAVALSIPATAKAIRSVLIMTVN